MFHGTCECEVKPGNVRIAYREINGDARVVVEAQNDVMKLVRSSEAETHLIFRKGEKTTGYVESEFGIIELEVFTHTYHCREHIVAVEYDILSGNEICDSFRIIWSIKDI